MTGSHKQRPPNGDENNGVVGVIFDIQRFSTDDGPGIRTTVFLKGCPLSCSWCHNPESQSLEPQLLFNPEKCIGCGKCREVCQHGGCVIETEAGPRLDYELCDGCGACVEVCYSGARQLSGRRVTVGEVLAELERDEPFYRNSGGGITLSGGEPCAQPEFARALLAECRSRGWHTCVDTCGYAPWDVLESLLEFTDLVLYDLKHLDGEKHVSFTGVDNRLILENLDRTVDTGTDVIVRVPLIPGVNDSLEDVDAILEYVCSRKVLGLTFLPYHRLGTAKYYHLGWEYRLAELESPKEEYLEWLRERVRECDVPVKVNP